MPKTRTYLFTLLFSLLTFSVSNSYGNIYEWMEISDEQFEKSLNRFEIFCIDENGDIRPEFYSNDLLFSCRDEANFILEGFKRREDALRENPELFNEVYPCAGLPDHNDLESFAMAASNVASQVSCTEVEKKEKKLSCATKWTCNGLRSLNFVSRSTLPSYLDNKIQRFSKAQTSDSKYPKDCLTSEKSNCLEEVWTAFWGNINATVDSLWGLATAVGKGIWNRDFSGFFSSKADKMHAAMMEKQSGVKSFLSNPGQWMWDKFETIKNTALYWVKSEVFCQDWKGEPHASKCLKPLESFDCLDCEDATNAICAAVGALASEAGMIFLTAGTFNAAAITAKVGTQAMIRASSAAAAKIKVMVPSLNRTGKATKSGVLAQKAIQAARLAKYAKLLASRKGRKIKRAAHRMRESFAKTTTGKIVAGIGDVASAVTDRIADPFRISDKVTRAGTRISNKAIASTKLGTLAKKAEKYDRQIKRQRHDRKFERHGIRKSKTVRSAQARKAIKRSKGPGSHHERSLRQAQDHDNYIGDRSSGRGRNQPEHGRDQRPKEESKLSSEHQHRNSEQQKPEKPGHQQDKEKRPEELAKSESEKRDKGDGKHHKEDEENNNQRTAKAKSSTMKKATAAAVAASVVAKANIASEIHQDVVAKEIANTEAAQELEAQVDSVESAAKVINPEGSGGQNGGESGDAGSSEPGHQELAQRAEQLNQLYSDENRETMVDAIQEANDISQEQANQFFDHRQSQIQSAREVLNDVVARKQQRSAREQSQKEGQARQAKEDKERKKRELSEKASALESKIAALEGEVQQFDQAEEMSSSPSPSSSPTADNSKTATTQSENTIFSNPMIPGTDQFVSPQAIQAPLANPLPQQFNENGDQVVAKNDKKEEKEGENKAGDTVQEESQEISEEAKKPKRSIASSLGLNMLLTELGMIDNQPEIDVKIPWSIKQITTGDREASEILAELDNLMGENSVATAKVTYQLSDQTVELYSFDEGQSFYFIVEKGKGPILISENRFIQLLEREKSKKQQRF